MKKIVVTIGILILATLVACGGSVDTDALVDQAADAAREGLDAAQDAIEEGVDSAQEAINEVTESDEAEEEVVVVEEEVVEEESAVEFEAGVNFWPQVGEGVVISVVGSEGGLSPYYGDPIATGFYAPSEDDLDVGIAAGISYSTLAINPSADSQVFMQWSVDEPFLQDIMAPISTAVQGMSTETLDLMRGDTLTIDIQAVDPAEPRGALDVTFNFFRDNASIGLFSFVTTNNAAPEEINVLQGKESGPMAFWSGVVWSDGVGVVGATISVNGVTAVSEDNGFFQVSAPEALDGRNVINADFDGYVGSSEIVAMPTERLVIDMQPAEVYVIDPNAGIDQVDSSGTQVVIDPGQLVDENGNPPEGEITMEMYTYDLDNEDMAGDMSGVNDEGEDVSMVSAGAFSTEFTDEAGNEYNLAPGATAEISIPADVAPPVDDQPLTVWSYNEETGLWEEEAVATFEDGRYVAEVSHFSKWNFDWEMRDPACVKLDIDPDYLAANTPLQVRAVLQTNPASVRDLSVTDAVNVLVNLPANTEVKFYLATDFSAPFATTNSGAPWGGVGTPAYPYDACKGVTEIVPVPEVTTGSISGQVTDAVTGDPLADAQVCIQGTPKCATTDASGNYTIDDVAPGEQVLNATKDGFIAVNDQAVTVVAGESANRPIAMSPELAAGEIRIVLSWGDNLKDLDSHLWLPDATVINYDVKGQSIQDTTLDLDDRDGSGPETITIMKQQDGNYTYAVNNYSGETTFAESGAVVRVYQGSREIKSYQAPTSGTGDWWHVFDLDTTTETITDVNQIVDNRPR